MNESEQYNKRGTQDGQSSSMKALHSRKLSVAGSALLFLSPTHKTIRFSIYVKVCAIHWSPTSSSDQLSWFCNCCCCSARDVNSGLWLNSAVSSVVTTTTHRCSIISLTVTPSSQPTLNNEITHCRLVEESVSQREGVRDVRDEEEKLSVQYPTMHCGGRKRDDLLGAGMLAGRADQALDGGDQLDSCLEET